jgi:hypothetical protein
MVYCLSKKWWTRGSNRNRVGIHHLTLHRLCHLPSTSRQTLTGAPAGSNGSVDGPALKRQSLAWFNGLCVSTSPDSRWASYVCHSFDLSCAFV